MCFIFIYFFYVTALVSFKFDSYLKVTCYICRVLAERDFSSLFSDFWLFILLLAFFPFKFLTYFLFNIYVYLYLSNSIYLGVLPIFLPHERVGDLSLSLSLVAEVLKELVERRFSSVGVTSSFEPRSHHLPAAPVFRIPLTL